MQHMKFPALFVVVAAAVVHAVVRLFLRLTNKISLIIPSRWYKWGVFRNIHLRHNHPSIPPLLLQLLVVCLPPRTGTGRRHLTILRLPYPGDLPRVCPIIGVGVRPLCRITGEPRLHLLPLVVLGDRLLCLRGTDTVPLLMPQI